MLRLLRRRLPLGRPTILLVDDFSGSLLRTGRRRPRAPGITRSKRWKAGEGKPYRRFRNGPPATCESPCDLIILDMSLLEERDGLEIFEADFGNYSLASALFWRAGHALNDRVQVRSSGGWLAREALHDGSLAETVAKVLESQSAGQELTSIAVDCGSS